MFLNKTVHNGIPLLLFLNMRTTLINFTFKRWTIPRINDTKSSKALLSRTTKMKMRGLFHLLKDLHILQALHSGALIINKHNIVSIKSIEIRNRRCRSNLRSMKTLILLMIKEFKNGNLQAKLLKTAVRSSYWIIPHKRHLCFSIINKYLRFQVHNKREARQLMTRDRKRLLIFIQQIKLMIISKLRKEGRRGINMHRQSANKIQIKRAVKLAE